MSVEKKKAVILFSGGVDSTTVLYKLLEEGYKVFPLIIYYGQRNEKEIDRAISILEPLAIDYKLLDCSEILSICDSELLGPDDEIYIGEQADYTVHSRNLLFMALGAMYAQNIKADILSLGIHALGFDYDCGPKFCEYMLEAIKCSDAHIVELYLPYKDFTKEELIEDGMRMGVPYEKTWTCYNNDSEPCGKCAACKERIRAFLDYDKI